MSWVAIARKDVQDSIRSRGLWGVIALFLGGILVLSWLADTGGTDETLLAAAGFTFFLGGLFFIPIVGLLISVKSIVRERESGTINLLLALPHTRGEMLLGKFVGRSIVMVIVVIVGFLPSLLYILVQSPGNPVLELFGLLFAASLIGIMWVGLGVALSALVNSETQATIGGVGVFFLLYLWPFIIDQLGVSTPDFVDRFWLLILFSDLGFLLPVFREGEFGFPSVIQLDEVILDEISGAGLSADIHMQMWFALVILALFVVVPLALGYWRFSQRDL